MKTPIPVILTALILFVTPCHASSVGTLKTIRDQVRQLSAMHDHDVEWLTIAQQETQAAQSEEKNAKDAVVELQKQIDQKDAFIKRQTAKIVSDRKQIESDAKKISKYEREKWVVCSVISILAVMYLMKFLTFIPPPWSFVSMGVIGLTVFGTIWKIL